MTVPIQLARNLTDQIYDAIVDEICDGRLTPGMHLVQEQLAERFGVSRQPIQQAMARLKADGMVEELGRRGLFVTLLNPTRMLQHYGIRAALDGYAARIAAQRAKTDEVFVAVTRREGRAILEAGKAAVAAGAVAEQIRLDDALHQLIYAASGNPMIATTAEPHWRFLRRAMADVLRQAQPAPEIWRQHAEILEAVVSGDPQTAETRALAHVENAAQRLASVLTETGGQAAPTRKTVANRKGHA
ncbi:MAG TPA: GntR family transcriptional regulator [Rhodopila sp.]|nr:GntR family transcriptional regulator [Rhodopila sp.]